MGISKQARAIQRLVRILCSIESMLPELEQEAVAAAPELKEIIAAQYLTPGHDERIKQWFTKFLSLRESLWEIIDEVHEQAAININDIKTDDEYRLFIIGFTAACQVVRLDRLLLDRVAAHTFIQRKLNEEIPENNVEPKQYTAIFEAFVNVGNAHKILQAIRFLDRKRRKIGNLLDDEWVGCFVRGLPKYRSYLDEHKRNYFKRSIDYFQHALRRRGARIKQQSQFRFLEVSGRVLSECVNKTNKLVTDEVREQLRGYLKPGDVFITRHNYALTNLFFPGFWPHSSMYIGNESERDALGIEVPIHIREKWRGKVCTFEALKDGVLLRSLEQTLAVDGFVVVRPTVSQTGIKRAIERVLVHEGKKYNFDFDFFRSDRLVCTELIYRAYDEIEHMKIELKERAGRPTLSAEDLCDLAIDTDMFDAIAIFGVDGGTILVVNALEVEDVLKSSYSREKF